MTPRPGLVDIAPGGAQPAGRRPVTAIYRTSDSYAGTKTVRPTSGTHDLWRQAHRRFLPHAAGRRHEYAVSRGSRASAMERIYQGRAHTTTTPPCAWLLRFPFAWCVPRFLLPRRRHVRSQKTYGIFAAGGFRLVREWRGYSPR